MENDIAREPIYVESIRDRRQLLAPYADCTANGPVFHKKTGRYFIFIYFPEGGKVYTQYARYLLAVKLGRRLVDDETVDHLDGNKVNDYPDNLDIASLAENYRRYTESADSPKAHFVQVTCPECSKIFLRQKRNYKFTMKGKFCACSHHCQGVIRRRLQTLSGFEREQYEAVLAKYLNNAVGVQGKTKTNVNGEHMVPPFQEWSTPMLESTFAGTKPHMTGRTTRYCAGCGDKLNTTNSTKKYCTPECRHEHLGTYPVPSLETILQKMSEIKSFVQLGKYFGVSDNAVRKWLVKYGREDLTRRKGDQ